MTKTNRNSGFALMEALVALTLIGLIAASAAGAMTILNRMATTNRLLSLAGSIVRDQTERLQTESPFNPQFGQVPAVLTTGTTDSIPPGLSTAYAPEFPLFTDGPSVLVFARMTTAISDTGNLNTYSATVTLTFEYGGRTFSIARNVLRTSDS